MENKLTKYLENLKGEMLGALNNNTNGVLEISIGLRKGVSYDQDNPSSVFMIKNTRVLIMTNRWNFSSTLFPNLSNTSSFRKSEETFVEVLPSKITGISIEGKLKKIIFETFEYKVEIESDKDFEMLVHDFDHQATLAVDDKGEVTITSKNKDFPFEG